VNFEVWAPAARRVDLVIRSERIAMEPGTRGWWTMVVDAQPGDYYGYSLDGGEALPDPRSPWQPLGVHGLSRLLDHGAFGWSDEGWRGTDVLGGVVYELHVGTFTEAGTFEAAIAKLDHLVELGVTAVELMPVAEAPGDRGWGYDGVDLYAPHHAYGGPEGLKRLVDACHERGLAAILDVVYNHLGPDGNYLGGFGPYFTGRYHIPWGDALNLDGPDSPEVRGFLLDNAAMWLEDYHFDALRIDAVHAIFDRSAVHLLEEMSARVEDIKNRLGRTLWLIAENDLNDPRIVTPRDAGGYGINAQWSDDFHHALHAVLTGERTGHYADFGALSQVAKALKDVYVYDGVYSEFRRRRHGRPAGDLPGSRFLGYVQNHDQIGNRALGERLNHLVSSDLLKVAAALVMTSPFVPMLFQGEEWGATSPFCYFADHHDEELARAVGEGRRRDLGSFGWDPGSIPDPSSVETYEMSKLNWRELDEPTHRELFEWHKALIALRHGAAELRDGRRDLVDVSCDDDAGWIVVTRGPIAVVANLSGTLVSVPAPPGDVVMTSAEDPETSGSEVRLGPESVTIFRA
jgi:maltooligosyltrehalose trehalohydrolase